MSNFCNDLTTMGCTNCNCSFQSFADTNPSCHPPAPCRRFAKFFVRNYHSTRHSSTKPNIRIDRSRHCPCFALWPIVTSFSDIKMRRWIRKCISWKIVTGNPGDTLGKRAIGLKEFLDGQPSAFKRNE
jgi:hypothetical protein